MDEAKRDVSKAKRVKSDHVKLAVTSYLQKRNYATVQVSSISTNEFLMHSLIQSELSRPNSVLYSCYNSDPMVIDQNFSKFVSWLKEITKNRKTFSDLENLVPPLFCHLYLDMLKGHPERASTFFKLHLSVIDKMKCEDFIKDLMNSLSNDNGDSSLKEHFRSNKYSVGLTKASLIALKKFVTENCHVVFLQVLQNWFDIYEIEEDVEASDNKVVSTEEDRLKFQELKDVINDLKSEPKPIFCVNIGNTKDEVNCAVIRRTNGIIAYSQQNSVRVRSIHPYDSIACHKDAKELCFNGHSDKVYDIAVSTRSEYIISGSSDATICIFDLLNAELKKICIGHLGPVYCVTVSEPAFFVASGSYDTTARLWSTDEGQMLRVFIGHSQPVTCIQFHPNNVYLATGSSDRTVRLWNIENGQTERLFQAAKGTIFAIAFHPLGQHIASASDDKRIHIWDILQSKMILELKYKDDVVTKLTWSEDGKFLCAGTLTGVVRIWDFENIQDNNTANAEVKFYEPCVTIRLHSKLLGVEYSCESFACVTS